MARFVYKAIAPSGSVITGTIEGESEQEVLGRIQADSLIPVEIKVHSGKGAGLDFSAIFKKRKRTTITDKDIFWFTQQFSRLLNSGFNVDQSFQLIMKQSSGSGLYSILQQIRSRIQEGKTLTESLAEFPQYFNSFYVYMVEAGELGGMLPQALRHVESFKSKQEKMKRKLYSSLAYPAIMVLTLLFTALIFLFFIIPEFATLYQEMNRELPLVTDMVLFSSQVFINYSWLLVVGVIGLLIMLQVWGKQKVSRTIDRFLLESGNVVPLYTEFISERFCRVLGSLVNSGVQVYPALEIVKKTIDNVFVKEHISNVQIGIQKGNPLAQMLWENQVYSEILIQGVDLGEQNGRLGELLDQLSDQFEESINGRVELFLGFIEPVMTLIVAVFVVIMILAMVLPMFDASTIV